MKKTLILLLLACLTLSAGCESQRGALKEQYAATIPVDSIYRYLSEKNQDLAQSDWREARPQVGHRQKCGVFMRRKRDPLRIGRYGRGRRPDCPGRLACTFPALFE